MPVFARAALHCSSIASNETNDRLNRRVCCFRANCHRRSFRVNDSRAEPACYFAARPSLIPFPRAGLFDTYSRGWKEKVHSALTIFQIRVSALPIKIPTSALSTFFAFKNNKPFFWGGFMKTALRLGFKTAISLLLVRCISTAEISITITPFRRMFFRPLKNSKCLLLF